MVWKMKNKWFVVFFVLLIFMFVACAIDNGNGDTSVEKSIKITEVSGSDIPSEYDMIRIRIFSSIGSGGVAVAGNGGRQIINGIIETPLVIVQNGGTNSDNPAWTGSGEYFIGVYFVKTDNSIAATFWYTNGAALTSESDVVKYNFTEALTILDFSKFKKQL
jgi:hypothetical protein